MEPRRRHRTRVSVFATLFVASLALTSPPANARADESSSKEPSAPPSSKTWTLRIEPSAPNIGPADLQPDSTTTTQVAALFLECNLTVEDPHYSSGASGVIFKIRYSCVGNTAGTLNVTGELYRWKPDNAYWQVNPRAMNVVSRPVGPGVSGTVYIPPASANGIFCSLTNYYYGGGYATLHAGGPGDRTNLGSNTTWGPRNRKCS